MDREEAMLADKAPKLLRGRKKGEEVDESERLFEAEAGKPE